MVLFPDTLQNALIGILKPLGLGKSALKIYIVVYYLIGLPFTIYISFKLELYTFGLWYGFLASVSLVCIFLIILILKTDWEAKIEEIHQMLEKQREQTSFNGLIEDKYLENF